jgi:hypothetical protein
MEVNRFLVYSAGFSTGCYSMKMASAGGLDFQSYFFVFMAVIFAIVGVFKLVADVFKVRSEQK